MPAIIDFHYCSNNIPNMASSKFGIKTSIRSGTLGILVFPCILITLLIQLSSCHEETIEPPMIFKAYEYKYKFKKGSWPTGELELDHNNMFYHKKFVNVNIEMDANGVYNYVNTWTINRSGIFHYAEDSTHIILSGEPNHPVYRFPGNWYLPDIGGSFKGQKYSSILLEQTNFLPSKSHYRTEVKVYYYLVEE